MKQNSEHGLLDFILNFKRHFGAKRCATDALTCICCWVIIPKDNKMAPSLLRMPCTVYLYGSEVSPTWSYKKNSLAFISSKPVSGFCFDSFYFITYLCLNEEKTYLIPTSKEICTSLYYFVLYYIYIYLFQFRVLYMMNIITTVNGFLFCLSVLAMCSWREHWSWLFPLCPLHLVSLCCSVSDNCTVFFFFF